MPPVEPGETHHGPVLEIPTTINQDFDIQTKEENVKKDDKTPKEKEATPPTQKE